MASVLGWAPVRSAGTAPLHPLAQPAAIRPKSGQANWAVRHRAARARGDRSHVLHVIAQAQAGMLGSARVVGEHYAEKPLKIVFVSAEVGPWSKTGGLGDVVGGLPIELAKRGHKVMTVAPRHDQYADAWDTSVTSHIDGEELRYFHTRKNGVDRVWVDHASFLSKVWGLTGHTDETLAVVRGRGSKLYGKKSGSDYADNQKRFVLFNKAAIEALRVLPFSPGEDCVVVANDWHTAMLPAIIKRVYQPNGEFRRTKTAFCVHNIAYQGRFWHDSFKQLGLPDSVLDCMAFEDGNPRVYDETEPDETIVLGEKGKRYPKLNWMKAGFMTADKLLTVSPHYAKEIASNVAKGVELDNVIRAAGGVEGIVNGMDTTDWNPSVDKFLDVKFDADTVEEGKAIAKETLQAELGLPVDPSVPLFGYIGRLEEQKGVDILMAALPKALAGSQKVQVAILGTGKKSLERELLQLDEQFPDAAKGIVQFSTPLAHQIIAGSDFMLIPSRFEPCGLIQLHAMQYGSVPLVATTGGLVDTVKDGVTGFHVGEFNADRLVKKDVHALAAAIGRAAEAFSTPAFKEMRHKAIAQDLSWKKPARQWEAVLDALASGRSTQPQGQAQAVPTPVQTPEHVARTEKATALREEARARVSSPREPENVDTSKPVQPKSAVGGEARSTQASAGAGRGAAARRGAPAAAGKAPAAAGKAPAAAAQPSAAAPAAGIKAAAKQPPSAAAPGSKPVPISAASGNGKPAAAQSSAPGNGKSTSDSKPATAQSSAPGNGKSAPGSKPATAAAGASAAPKQTSGPGASQPLSGVKTAGSSSKSE